MWVASFLRQVRWRREMLSSTYMEGGKPDEENIDQADRSGGARAGLRHRVCRDVYATTTGPERRRNRCGSGRGDRRDCRRSAHGCPHRRWCGRPYRRPVGGHQEIAALTLVTDDTEEQHFEAE